MRTPFIPALGLAALLFTAALASCSGGGSPPPDEQDTDAGTHVPDAGGGMDASVPDAGGDSGTPDAGDTVDAGTPDGGADAGPGLPDGSVVIPTVLSGFGLFTGSPSDGGLQPVEGNVPYTLTTPLFSDYSLKSRTLYIPPGKQAQYTADEVLDLPVGTLITKTFSFPADLREPDKDVRVIETRVLVRQPGGWEAHPYVWNAEGTEATRKAGGDVIQGLEFIDEAGVTRKFDYLVPSRNQCLKCHHVKDASGTQVLLPIGVKARYLNQDHLYGGQVRNQLQHLADLGRLAGLPATGVPRAPDAFNPAEATLAVRTRTYLDINCAHCHNPKNQAGETSQLFLNVQNTNEFNLGYCKRPGSAGNDVGGEFDIVPGSHDSSILWYRVHTEESGKMMPEIGRALRHEQGAQLIADWIDSLPARSCE